MKNVIKFILSFICYVIFIPCILACSICVTWYTLPNFQLTQLGAYLGQMVGQEAMLLTTIIVTSATFIFLILGKLFTVVKNSKALNFYTHLITWLVALFLAAEAIYSFVASDTIHAEAVELDLSRKIGILACTVAMLLYAMIAPKIRKLVDRRIQAYDTAKELNAKGRSSVVGMQILKCFDFICPEMFLLTALCFAFNWEVSLYFIFIISAFIVPIVGNMICDHRVKKEAVKKEVEMQEAQVNATAEAVVDLLKHNGGNP